MLYDILKDTPAFQKIANEGRLAGLQEGLQEGRQAGLQEGRQEGLRLTIVDMVEARFDDETLVEQARAHVAKITDVDTLRRLVVKVAQITTPTEVELLLAHYEQPVAEQGRKKAARPRKKKIAE